MGSIGNMSRSLRSNTSISPPQPSVQTLFNNIRKEILNTHHSADLEFPGIPPDIGLLLTRSLDEDAEIERAHPRISFNSHTSTLTARIMPTDIHDCHQEWLEKELRSMIRAGFMTDAERDELNLRTGTTFDAFVGAYASSSKQPDVCIRPDTLPLPTVALESGWTESWPRLFSDKNHWLVGGPMVKAVILVRWTKIVGGHVKGDLQLYGRNATGNVVLIQAEPIFPAPPGRQTQTIPLTRGQIFGPNLPTGRNPADTYNLSMEVLREKADGPIRAMGFTPAP